MWNDVVVEALVPNLRVACGLRIEFKNFCLQVGELATELWRLVPIYRVFQKDLNDLNLVYFTY